MFEEIKAKNGNIEAAVSCLASRSGIKKGAYAIDYQPTNKCLDSDITTKARHFAMASSRCKSTMTSLQLKDKSTRYDPYTSMFATKGAYLQLNYVDSTMTA
jgi:hypothetical protein